MSRFSVDVVTVQKEPHPNADSLSLVRVGGYVAVVRSDDWQDGDLGAYVPPDSLVDTSRSEFAFLEGHERIKVRRLRGVYSQGLLVKAPAGAALGDDVAECLGVTHYEPPLLLAGADDEPGPQDGIHRPHYDVENFNRYPNLLVPGELVVITEKIHGANGRFTYVDGRLYAGSRTRWLKEGNNPWWLALGACEPLQQFLSSRPGDTVYGEVYGRVQSLRYGLPQGLALAVFDILAPTSAWFDAYQLDQRCRDWGLPRVPVLYQGPFDEQKARDLAEGPSTVAGADHVREGVVIRPLVERFDIEFGGRVQLKIVGNGYLEKA